MKKLKTKLNQLRSVISIKTYKRPMIFIIVSMLLINIIILVIAAFIALLIDDSFTGFIDAFANGSLKWMLTPNAILSIENPKTLFLAVVVLIIGLILFSGTIIALTTNAIKDYFHKKQSGGGKIYLDKHIVVLNWNNKVPELVADLLFIEQKNMTIIILANIEKGFAEKQIVNAIQKTNHENIDLSKLRVLVKTGDPLLHRDLEDVSIEHAIAILVMNNDAHDEIVEHFSQSDLNVIKIILNLGKVQFEYQPAIVAEIKHIETKTKILTMQKIVAGLTDKTIIPVCFDRRLGQIIAQTIINYQIEDVYLSLFSFMGSEVYYVENTDFKDCLMHASHAIPLDACGKNLFVLSMSHQAKDLKTKDEPTIVPLKTKVISEKENLEVYIIGKNNKLNFILESFKMYEKLHGSHFHAKWVSDEELDDAIKDINEAARPVVVVLLSNEQQQHDALDANVINTLLYLEGVLTKKDINIIVELLDPKNDHIIRDFNIRNTIISNKIISLLLSKLALFKETAAFYENLLTIDATQTGIDEQAILIKMANDCFDMPFPLRFDSYKSLIASSYYAFDEKMILIGMFRDQQLEIFEGPLHYHEIIEILANDALVFIKR